MLRIEIDDEGTGVATVRLYGTITAESLPSLEPVVAHRRANAPLVVDLGGVTNLDRTAIEFLAAAKRDGVRLRNARGFVRTWLRAESRSHLPRLLWFVLATVALAAVARADEVPDRRHRTLIEEPRESDAPAKESDWQFRATLYGFLPHIGGAVTFPTGTGRDIDIDQQSLLDHLNFTFMGSLEAQKGRWGAFTDIVYMDVGGSRSRSRDFRIGRAGLPVGITANASLDVTAWVWTVAGSYRVLSTPRASLDVFAGTRLLDVQGDLDLQFDVKVGRRLGLRRNLSSTSGLQVWDGITGAKGRLDVGAPRGWFLPYYLDVGTGGSDVTWQGNAGVGYAFPRWEVVAAWRYLAYEFPSAERIDSLDFNGPSLGITVAW